MNAKERLKQVKIDVAALRREQDKLEQQIRDESQKFVIGKHPEGNEIGFYLEKSNGIVYLRAVKKAGNYYLLSINKNGTITRPVCISRTLGLKTNGIGQLDIE